MIMRYFIQKRMLLLAGKVLSERIGGLSLAYQNSPKNGGGVVKSSYFICFNLVVFSLSPFYFSKILVLLINRCITLKIKEIKSKKKN